MGQGPKATGYGLAGRGSPRMPLVRAFIQASVGALLGVALVGCDPEGDDTGGDDTSDSADTEDTALDPAADADGDGISTGEEETDATDPLDPRSARAWHPEITGHPRLFLGPGDVEAVAVRISLTEGAHPTVWARIVSKAGQEPPVQPTDGTYDPGVAAQQGDIAEAAAFVGLLTDDAAMTAKAAGILSASFPSPLYLNSASPFDVGEHYDLIEAEALVSMCTAYDYVAGTEGVSPDDVAAARSRLIERVDYFRTMCFEGGGCRNLIRNERNNHTLKPLGALGLCAMAIPDRPEAAADFSEAVTGVDYLLNEHQGSAEGGYAESWSYLVYGGQTFVPLLAAVHRVDPGATWHVRGEGAVVADDPRNGQATEVLDFAANPTTQGVFRGMLYASQPDGLTPPVDDANPGSAPGGLLAAMFDDPAFLWNWQQPRVGYATPRATTSTFALLDPTMQATPPDWALDTFLPDAGYSVLRSSWDAGQLYVLAVHEHGNMRTSGFSHEHADNLSFLVHAYGEPLIVDPGYIEWAEHHRVKYGRDHNLVLVDGEGPPYPLFDSVSQTAPETDAWLYDWESDGGFTTLLAGSAYEGATIHRRLVRIDSRLIVVADTLVDDGGGAPKWTWQINGYAGGTLTGTTFTASSLGGTWSRPLAKVQVAAVPTIGTATWIQTEEDSLNSQGLKRHVRRAAEATMGAGAGFLAVIAPTPAADGALGLAEVDLADGDAAIVVSDAVGTPTDVLVLNRGASAVTVTWSGGSFDAPPGLSWRAASGGEIRTWGLVP